MVIRRRQATFEYVPSILRFCPLNVDHLQSRHDIKRRAGIEASADAVHEKRRVRSAEHLTFAIAKRIEGTPHQIVSYRIEGTPHKKRRKKGDQKTNYRGRTPRV